MNRRSIQAVIGWTDETALLLLDAFKGRLDEGELAMSSNTTELWRLIRRHHPRLLVMNSNISGTPLDEFVAMIRTEDNLSSTSIIVILPKTHEEERRKFILLGTTAVFSLPLDLQEFFSVSARILGLSYRKTIRFPVMISVTVHGEEICSECLCHNISRSGMLLYSQNKLSNAGELRVIFEPKDGEGSLEVKFRIIRSSENSRAWYYGVQFFDISPNTIYRLERYISTQVSPASN
ncbi:MAG: PilZ domain-containing protein [Deltaproteobacteria bacterium]|nr:PilZ domain-containing protein [Deltaproteobacteria bacterium]